MDGAGASISQGSSVLLSQALWRAMCSRPCTSPLLGSGSTVVSSVVRASRGSHGGAEVGSAHRLPPICLPDTQGSHVLIAYLIAAKYQRMCCWVPGVLFLGRTLSVPGAPNSTCFSSTGLRFSRYPWSITVTHLGVQLSQWGTVNPRSDI